MLSSPLGKWRPWSIWINWILLTQIYCTLSQDWFKWTHAVYVKDSGRIKRRFGRIVGIQKRLQNYRLSNAFLNAIRFIEYRNMGEYLPRFILFLQNMILKKATRSIWLWKSTNLVLFFKNFVCLWVFSPRIWNGFWMRFLTKEFTASI